MVFYRIYIYMEVFNESFYWIFRIKLCLTFARTWTHCIYSLVTNNDWIKYNHGIEFRKIHNGKMEEGELPYNYEDDVRGQDISMGNAET